MREATETDSQIEHTRKLLDDVIVAINKGDAPRFVRAHKEYVQAASDIALVWGAQIGQNLGSTSTTAPPWATSVSASAKDAADKAVATADGLSLETKRRLKRAGLDTKYAGIRSADQLADLED